MSLSDKLKIAAEHSSKRFCKIGVLLQNLPSKDRIALEEAINTPEGTPNRISNSDLFKLLREENYDISLSTVDRHRRHTCGCFLFTKGN